MPPILDPIADWLETLGILQHVLTLIAILVAWKLVWKFLKSASPGVRAAIRFFTALGTLPAFMVESRAASDRHEVLIREVRHEVMPNDGSSMRDELTTLGLRVESGEAKDARDFARLSAIEEELSLRIRQSRGVPPATSPRLRVIRGQDLPTTEE